MGVDKATLVLDAKPLLELMKERLAAALRTRADAVLVSGRSDGVADLHPGLGPLGGLASVLEWLEADPGETRYLLVAPVDMPFLDVSTLQALLSAVEGHEGAIYRGYELPAAIAVTERVREVLRQQLEQASAAGAAGLRSVRRLLASLDIAELDPTGVPVRALMNVNTPEEWRRCAT